MNFLFPRYNLFLAAALLSGLCAFLVKDGTFDIQLSDTYYVIAHVHLFEIVSILLFSGWLLYRLTSRWLYSARLSFAHIVLTLLSLLIILADGLWLGQPPVLRHGMNFPGLAAFRRFDLYNHILDDCLLVLAAAQGLYFVNLVPGIVKYRRGK
jgi:heme/copper-type cytochrome/quinol oxidase subunit 1